MRGALLGWGSLSKITSWTRGTQDLAVFNA